MRRILLICNEYPPRPHAGIGTAVQLIARGLSQSGNPVTIVGLGDTFEEHSDGAIRVFTIQRSKTKYVGNLISRVRLRNWLSAYVQSEKIELIECPDSAGMLPFGFKWCPVVIRLHLSFTAVNRVTNERAGPAISFYERRTVTGNPNWIAVSNYVRDLTQSAFNFAPKRCATVYNPILPPPAELPSLSGLPEKYILYAGHVCRRKGADVLAEAVRDLLIKRKDLHLVYAGGVFIEDGRSISDDILATVGPDLAPRVRFLGRVSRRELLGLMMGARVFAFPSHVEGFPMVVLEALSCGLPVVFTKYPPGPEIIEHGRTGLLGDPNNPKDFGAQISRILDNSALGKELASNGRKRVADCFSVEKCVAGTEKFYEDCLRTRADGEGFAVTAGMQ